MSGLVEDFSTATYKNIEELVLPSSCPRCVVVVGFVPTLEPL